MPKICALIKDAISGMSAFGDDYILPNLNLKIEIREN